MGVECIRPRHSPQWTPRAPTPYNIRVPLLLAALLALAQEKPNVLVLLSDDQRFDTIAALGNPEIRTPHLDALARRGFAFTRAFCMGAMQGAVCVPSRAMILSGRSLFRAPAALPAPLPLWPESMRQAGYRDFFTGKWHNNAPSFARAFTAGEAIFFGGMSDQNRVPVHRFDPSGKYGPATRRIGEKFSSELFADAAIDFLKGHKGPEPFFLEVAFTSPHDPRTPPGEFASMYDPAKLALPPNFLPEHPFDNGEMKVRDEKLEAWPRAPEKIRGHIAAYYGMISHLDAQVGRILQALEETGRAKNTIVLFMSDHGLAVGRHGLLGKQNLYEHSMRPPLLFAGPGIPVGRSDALCYLFDLFPTVCDLAGVPVPEGVEGKSLAPILRGRALKVRETIFGAYREVQRSIRTERWKLIRYPKIDRTQLFDLDADPDEMKDLAADPAHAGRLQEMMDLLKRHQAEFGDTLK